MAWTFGSIFLDGIKATRNLEQNLFYVASIRGENSLLLFILLKKIWLNLWFGTALCKTPTEFHATIWVFVWSMLFATMATLSVSIVSMHLESFTYFTFGSHCGKSFKLSYKKIKTLHKQGLHPAEILKALKGC